TIQLLRMFHPERRGRKAVAKDRRAGQAGGSVQEKIMTWPRLQLHDRRAELLFIAAFASIVATGCHPANSARGVVDRFIDRYYVAIDLKAAEPLCTGLALDKLHKEMQRIGNQKTAANTRKPVVHYKLPAE